MTTNLVVIFPFQMEAWVNFPTIHSNNHIAQGIRIKFAVGAYFDSEGQLRKEIDDFARNHLFTVRKHGRNRIVCSRSAN